MKITAPYLGMLHRAYGPVLKKAGVEIVYPPKPTKRTLDLGTKYAPEFACFPFKVTLGSMMEALELGADTIFMIGGWGPCRFGYYDVIQEQILKNLGYQFTMGSAHNPDNLRDMLDLMQRIAGIHSRLGLYKLFFSILVRLSMLDWILKKYFHTKPYEAISGEADLIYGKGIFLMENSFSLPQLLKSVSIISLRFGRMKKRKGIHPLRVGIVGELFTVLDPSANMEIDMWLARRGIEVQKSVWLSDYANDRFRFKPFRRNQFKFSSRHARPYLRFHSGGESIESVGKTVYFAKNGVDGVIHIFPFTCMPELVAQTILMKVQKDLDIPILTLIIDEHTAPGGVETRLEAFIDLLERRRSRR
jgi:predicted nucleotide-binding protein (sugar kinase/HSP70/actin superfamily)